jgi:transcriptional regulator with GAF, ATPase, and Fis domain
MQMMAVPQKPKSKRRAPERRRSLFAEIGRQAAQEAQRKLLAATLVAKGWNLTHTAEALGLSTPSEVIRAIKALDLTAEYEAAKGKGLVVQGRPKAS